MKHSCDISCDLCALCSFSSDVVSGMPELILMLFLRIILSGFTFNISCVYSIKNK